MRWFVDYIYRNTGHSTVSVIKVRRVTGHLGGKVAAGFVPRFVVAFVYTTDKVLVFFFMALAQ